MSKQFTENYIHNNKLKWENDLLVTSKRLRWKKFNDSWVAMKTVPSNTGGSETVTYAAF